jgi:hypothetical protein
MGCTPLSVSLEVDPTELRKIVIKLDKFCISDGTVEWKMQFDLTERKDTSQDYRTLVSLAVDINPQDHRLAAATAENGLDHDQRAQAHVAGDTAKATLDGSATQEEAKQDAQDVIAVRNPASPEAADPAA